MRKSWLVVVATTVLGMCVTPAPVSGAICGSVGGVHVDVTGCADPLSELDGALEYPPPPPPPPPVYIPPAPNVSVCADVGRRINVAGCI